MVIEETAIVGVLIVRPKKHGDHRGFFSETFKNADLVDFGVDLAWVQDNHSYSTTRGVVRGLHFQTAPHAQAKLLRVTRGAILDVAVDVRRGSPTYGQHVSAELSADNWAQLLVPAGFAHGFCTLTDETEVLYKVSAPYAPDLESGLMWNDPDLAIDWPIEASQAVLSARDTQWGPFATFESPFVFTR